jgi:hypothetical protein
MSTPGDFASSMLKLLSLDFDSKRMMIIVTRGLVEAGSSTIWTDRSFTREGTPG